MEQDVNIVLPAHAEKALALLERSGFEAWCVGGCVRDSLLGLCPGDWDIATSALPVETKQCFQAFRTVDTGIRHGTVTVLLAGNAVEITTYRRDGAYADHRHPEDVCFSRRLEDDLSRRDFTVNALAYHPSRGLVDRFGGLSDLRHRELRCVGDAARRFSEDALRILRCLRFSAVLGFSIEESARKALWEQRGLLRNISRERVRDELTKLLCGRDAAEVLRRSSGVLFSVLPELAPMEACAQETRYHCYSVWEHTLHVLDASPPTPAVRWAALLHDCGKPSCKTFGPDKTAHFRGHAQESERLAREILDRLRFSNRETEEVCALIRYHGERPPLPEKRLKKLLGKLGADTLARLFELMRADLAAKAPGLYEERIGALEDCEALAGDILRRGECLTLRGLAVNGNDLLALGFSRDERLGKALHVLLDEVLEGTLQNERQALLRRAGDLL